MSVDRFFDSMAAIVRKAIPWVGYCGTYEYAVFTANPPKYDLRAVDPLAGLPPLPDVPFKPGIPGLTSALQVGSLVYVTFINHDSARPFIVAVADSADAGFTPTSLAVASSGITSIDGSSVHAGAALGAVVRVGDTITVGTGVAASNGSAGVVALTTGLGIPPLPSRLLA